MSRQSSLAAILAEQRRAAGAVIAEPGRGVRLWLADAVAEELAIMEEEMSETKTMGQVAYEAAADRVKRWKVCPSWFEQTEWERNDYEAIAADVIAAHEAQRQKSVESSTYGDLVKACPSVAENIVNHEWDNLPIWQQRDWLMQQLAQRPASGDERHRSFFARVWAAREGIESWDIESAAVECGLAERVQASAPCGDACACEMYGFPGECVRLKLPSVPR